MGLFSRKSKSPNPENRALGRGSSMAGPSNNPYSQQQYPPSNNPFTDQSGAPPAYQLMNPPQGAAASYYGGAPQPQYPPAAQAGPAGPPNPLINRQSLPLPTANPTMGADDPYTFLTKFDTVILVDDSGSMAGGRWDQTAAALSTIVPIVTYYDTDGIDLFFLNRKDHPQHHNIRTPGQVMEIFRTVTPRGATPTGEALKRLLKPYVERYQKSPNSVKPMNIIVITDGVPTDDVESVITQYAKKLDHADADLTQVGIQFFQIGDDPGATEALKELDDALAEMKDIRDMVDTVPWRGSLQGDVMLKVVLGAVNKRLDRKRV